MECIAPKYLSERDITVPCGRCGFCLSTRRSDWVNRLAIESRKHLDKSFITLTYANPHLHFEKGKPQLVKADLQKWLKRVRKAGYRIRYYACGEYGSKTFRPHYHVILFGDVPEDVIRKTWPKGQVHIGKVTIESIAYCAKYIINSKALYMKHERQTPFATMSRRPAIGSQYLTKEMIAWHKSGLKNYMLVDGKKRHLPKYFKDKIFTKRERSIIGALAQKDSLETLRQELKELSKHHSNAMEYREERRLRMEKSIRDKSKQSLTI